MFCECAAKNPAFDHPADHSIFFARLSTMRICLSDSGALGLALALPSGWVASITSRAAVGFCPVGQRVLV
jgi:hypothetical protein